MRPLSAVLFFVLVAAAIASTPAGAAPAARPVSGDGDGHSVRYRRSCAECAGTEFCEYGTAREGHVSCVAYAGLPDLYRRYAATADEPDPCSSSPCQNNGTCTKTSPTAYTCSCSAPWGGDNCGTRINYCAQNICGANGVCTVRNVAPFYSCTCNAGYDGTRCDNKYFTCPSVGDFGDVKKCSSYFACVIDSNSNLVFSSKTCQKIGPVVWVWDIAGSCRAPNVAVKTPGCT